MLDYVIFQIIEVRNVSHHLTSELEIEVFVIRNVVSDAQVDGWKSLLCNLDLALLHLSKGAVVHGLNGGCPLQLGDYTDFAEKASLVQLAECVSPVGQPFKALLLVLFFVFVFF